ncbi:MAG: hypothetical protein Q9213_005891 [Squamulea squamosa]
MRNHFKCALLAAGLTNIIGALATVTLTTRVYSSICYPSDAPGGNGGGKPGEVQTVSSNYGIYSLSGCYAAPSSGYLLDGKTSVSVGMTLASCASYCSGSAFFALQNGNQCLCGSKAPSTTPLGSGNCNTGCSGNPAEHCGTSSTCIVYTSSPPPPSPGGSVSVTTYTTTGTGGIVSTVTSSTTLPLSPTGTISITTYTTTGTNGIVSTVTSSTTLPPSPPVSVSVTTYTTTGANGIASTITSSTTLPPPPPPTVSTTTYTTTRPDGIVSTVTSQTTIPRSVSLSTYITTGTNGIVSTVTTSTTVPVPPPPPPPTSVVTVSSFTSTRPDGSVIVVKTSVTVPPPPPVSTSVTTQVTTNPAGSTITTTRSSVVTPPVSSNLPPPPATTVIVSSSTNAQGSVVVSSLTSTAAVPYYSAACGGQYSDNFGQLWCIQCQTAYYYNDLTTITLGSFEECLEACDTYVPSPNVARGASCIAITWGPRTVGGECYRKFNVTDSRFDRREDSAYKCDQAVVPPSASSIINTNTGNIASTGASTLGSSVPNAPSSGPGLPATSNPTVPTTHPTTPATSNPNVPATSNPTVPATRPTTPATSNPNVPATTPPASSLGVPATLISSSTTASSVNLELAFQPCPSSNGQQFTDQSGTVYNINCGCDYQYSDLSGATHQDYFQDCMLACDRYVPDPNIARGAPCIGVSWGRPDRNPGGNCYLKYRIENVRCGYPDYCAAVKYTYTIPTGIVSTSRVTSTASVVPVPSSSGNGGNGVTSNLAATSSQPPVVVASSSTSQPPIVVASSSTSQPPVVLPSSSTSPAAVISSSTNSPPAVVAPSSSANTYSPTNTFAAPQISQSVSCPAQNGSIYTDRFGQGWEVRCGQNIRGTNAKAVHADSWEKCLEFCDILGNVTGVTYPGGGGDNTNSLSVNCYPYSVFTEFVSGAVPTLVGARPLNVSTGNAFNTEQLCPGYDNETYTDTFSRTYQIRCDHGIGGNDLAGTITKTLEGCLTYCSTYNTCVGVVFTRYIVGDRTNNCYPKSSAGVLSYQSGNSSAQLL